MQKLLLLGTGVIAAHHVAEFAAIAECGIVACVDLLPGKAKAFADANGIAHHFESPTASTRRRRLSCSPPASMSCARSRWRRAMPMRWP